MQPREGRQCAAQHRPDDRLVELDDEPPSQPRHQPGGQLRHRLGERLREIAAGPLVGKNVGHGRMSEPHRRGQRPGAGQRNLQRTAVVLGEFFDVVQVAAPPALGAPLRRIGAGGQSPAVGGQLAGLFEQPEGSPDHRRGRVPGGQFGPGQQIGQQIGDDPGGLPEIASGHGAQRSDDHQAALLAERTAELMTELPITRSPS